MFKIFSFSLAFFLLCSFSSPAQNTVGLISVNAGEIFTGYNLVYPHNQPDVYLFDQCGQIVHTWTDTADYRPGNTAYLMPSGDLVKTKRHNNSINDPIWAGGGGDIVEILGWDNLVKYRYALNNTEYRLHHDIAPMPNGNVLMIVWEKKTRAEAIAAGRDSTLLPGGELWSEAIFEWDPLQDKIVWSWRLWDHLISENDSEKSGNTKVSDHPELININYDEHDGHQDWLHANALDYNPVLDQILISIPYFNEFWIIDHSTTAAQAAGSTGGNAGKGGDIIYRWGNPAAYDSGDAADKQLYFQHDAHWADPAAGPGDPYFGMVLAFNNQAPDNRSPVYLIDTGVDPLTRTYAFEEGKYGPNDPTRIYTYPGEEPRSMSESLSSSQLLPNGNILIMAGRWGFAYELNEAGEVVWQYILPLKNGGPATQGDTLSINNNLAFRLNRYAADYPAFAGKDLSPLGYWELNPNIAFCEMLLPVDVKSDLLDDLEVYPNPARGYLTVGSEDILRTKAVLLDVSGRVVRQIELEGVKTLIPTESLPAGVYWLKAVGRVVKKVVILP